MSMERWQELDRAITHLGTAVADWRQGRAERHATVKGKIDLNAMDRVHRSEDPADALIRGGLVAVGLGDLLSRRATADLAGTTFAAEGEKLVATIDRVLAAELAREKAA